MRVTVQAGTCVGCGVCADFCPSVFRIVGKVATVAVDTVPQAMHDLTQATADVCPVDAIRVEE